MAHQFSGPTNAELERIGDLSGSAVKKDRYTAILALEGHIRRDNHDPDPYAAILCALTNPTTEREPENRGRAFQAIANVIQHASDTGTNATNPHKNFASAIDEGLKRERQNPYALRMAVEAAETVLKCTGDYPILKEGLTALQADGTYPPLQEMANDLIYLYKDSKPKNSAGNWPLPLKNIRIIFDTAQNIGTATTTGEKQRALATKLDEMQQQNSPYILTGLFYDCTNGSAPSGFEERKTELTVKFSENERQEILANVGQGVVTEFGSLELLTNGDYLGKISL